jgi:hypothetical protein
VLAAQVESHRAVKKVFQFTAAIIQILGFILTAHWFGFLGLWPAFQTLLIRFFQIHLQA